MQTDPPYDRYNLFTFYMQEVLSWLLSLQYMWQVLINITATVTILPLSHYHCHRPFLQAPLIHPCYVLTRCQVDSDSALDGGHISLTSNYTHGWLINHLERPTAMQSIIHYVHSYGATWNTLKASSMTLGFPWLIGEFSQCNNYCHILSG